MNHLLQFCPLKLETQKSISCNYAIMLMHIIGPMAPSGGDAEIAGLDIAGLESSPAKRSNLLPSKDRG